MKQMVCGKFAESLVFVSFDVFQYHILRKEFDFVLDY